MATAQNGSIIISPQFTGHIQGNVYMNPNVSYQHGQETTSDPPDSEEYIKKCQTELKGFLEVTKTKLVEGIGPDRATSVDNIYTELDITEGISGENKINLNDIFKLSPKEDKTPRTVLTKGIAGIGKTVSVLKFTRDWTRKEDDQTFEFIFPITFRDLSLIKDETLSLVMLITRHFNVVKDLKDSDYDNLNVLFIFDGLDESQLPLNFMGNRVWSSVTEPTTVDILLTNLITGKLMRNASVWITSRPAASAKIPSGFIDRVTEVQGFNDEQKEKYFLKKVKDKDMAQKILEHLQSKPLRSLYVMCHIPVFCWSSANFVQDLLTETPRGELPKTVTEIYTHFLIAQTMITHEKNYEGKEADKVLIMKLGKLAFEQLQKGNVIFEEEDLTSCQIDLTHAVVHSGVCTEIIKVVRAIYIEYTYSFIHLTVQEFLASLYVLETLIESGQNLLQRKKFWRRKRKLSSLHKKGVDMALKSKNGQWDLFLRFLLGLSQDEIQKRIHTLGFKKLSPGSNEKIIKYIHENINLFHCLNELGDQSLVWLDLSGKKLEDHGMELLSDGLKSPNCRLQKLTLADCQFSVAGCGHLASSLKSNPAHLRVLDLSNNQLKDAGVDRLSEFLKEPRCKLEKLRLKDCNLAGRCCKFISSVLKLKSCSVEELDLSRNKLQDPGMERLSDGLESPNCRLQKLTLAGCQFSEVGCGYLASSLTLNPAHLRVLDLSNNQLKDAGVDRLSEFLKEPRCKLEKLRLKCCSLTDDSCKCLALCRPSSLKELDLSDNQQTDRGEELLRDRRCSEIQRLPEKTLDHKMTGTPGPPVAKKKKKL